MKIAIISIWEISKDAIGGTERFVKDLAENFVILGNMVDVYMLSGRSYKDNGVNYISLDFFGKGVSVNEFLIQKEFGDFQLEENYLKLAKHLEYKIQEDYDLFQLNSHILLKAWQNKHRIFTVHCTHTEFRLMWSEEAFLKMVEIKENEGKNSLTKFVVPSSYYCDKWNSILSFKLYYIPHAINKNRLLTKKSKASICEKYSINNDLIKILLPSRLEPIQKQPMLFLDCCSSLSEQWKNKIQIVFSGTDKHYEKYVKEMKDYSYKNKLNTNFLRFENISEGLSIADIVVLPSKTESFGYSALESLSLGITTILNDIPPFKEIAKGNKKAYFFNGTSQDLYTVLMNILENDDFNSRIQPEDKWLERYNTISWAKNYLNLFN